MKMKMKIYLSNRQRKELERGNGIGIAVPYPDEGIVGAYRHHDGTGVISARALERWLRESLVLDAEYRVLAIGLCDVPVTMTERTGGGLAAILGTIERTRGEMWTVRLVCVRADISMRGQPLTVYPATWPGRLEVRGKSFGGD